jgi:hypothetical protein
MRRMLEETTHTLYDPTARRGSNVTLVDVLAASSNYPAVQNILLAANPHESGSVSPTAAVYIGRPATKLGTPRRRPAAVTHRKQHGTPR